MHLVGCTLERVLQFVNIFSANKLAILFFCFSYNQQTQINITTVSLYIVYITTCGPGGLVGIATELRAERSGDRIPVEKRFSASPDRPWGPPSLLYNGYRIFHGGKVWPGRAADHSPPSSAEVLEE